MNFFRKMALAACLFGFTPLAQAYVGPGAGLSAIGTIIAFLAAIALMVIGFLWYPIKRLFKGKKDSSVQNQALPGSTAEKTDSEQIGQ